MASLTDFPPFVVAQFIQGIMDKGKMKLGGTASFIDAELTIEEVRQIWAAAKHLEFMSDWGVGIEKTRFSLNECREWLEELKKVAKGSLRLRLDYVDIAILKDVATHVDRLGMMQEDGGKSSRKSRRR